MEEKNEHMSKMIGQMMAATGVPSCFLCGKRIVGAHIDYMDKDRTPQKVCVGCIFQALDYYLNAKEKALRGENP